MTEPLADAPATPATAVALPLHRPLATWVLLALIGLAFAAEVAAGALARPDVLLDLGAKYSPLIAAGEYWRLFTSMFLHADLMHLAFNGYALWVIGTELERILGTGRFVAVYLLSGLFGSLASYAFDPDVAVGASGAIFGLIGALAVFFLLYRERLGRYGRSRLANIAFLIALNLFLGFTNPRIDNLAHVGGLLAGAALGWSLAPRYELDAFALRFRDRNRVARYWPALLLAVVALVGGTLAATLVQSDSPELHLLRGREAVDLEAWDQAAAEFEQAVAGDPDLTEAHFYLGVARNNLSQHDLAAVAYARALELEPDLAEAHWNLALTYLELGLPAEARSHLETYLRLSPDDADRARHLLDQIPAP